MATDDMEGKFHYSLTEWHSALPTSRSVPLLLVASTQGLPTAEARWSNMLTLCRTVTINLTPLGHDEGQNHRAIILHGDKKEVEIGRASKNANKGLLSAFDNAWFDYPILSRAHAKFTVSLPQKVCKYSQSRQE